MISTVLWPSYAAKMFLNILEPEHFMHCCHWPVLLSGLQSIAKLLSNGNMTRHWCTKNKYVCILPFYVHYKKSCKLLNEQLWELTRELHWDKFFSASPPHYCHSAADDSTVWPSGVTGWRQCTLTVASMRYCQEHWSSPRGRSYAGEKISACCLVLRNLCHMLSIFHTTLFCWAPFRFSVRSVCRLEPGVTSFHFLLISYDASWFSQLIHSIWGFCRVWSPTVYQWMNTLHHAFPVELYFVRLCDQYVVVCLLPIFISDAIAHDASCSKFTNLGGQAIWRRHSRFRGSKGCCHGNHFWLSIYGGAHWRHLKNTTEPSMCGGDAAFCQITLTTCLFSLL